MKLNTVLKSIIFNLALVILLAGCSGTTDKSTDSTDDEAASESETPVLDTDGDGNANEVDDDDDGDGMLDIDDTDDDGDGVSDDSDYDYLDTDADGIVDASDDDDDGDGAADVSDDDDDGDGVADQVDTGTLDSDGDGTPDAYDVETPTVTSSESSIDTSSESATDSGSDSSTETGTESATDSGSDSSTETGTESATDSGSDSSTETSTESATDSGSDSSTETSTDTATRTRTRTRTDTRTGTRSGTATSGTVTFSGTRTMHGSFTWTGTGSRTGTRSGTGTRTGTAMGCTKTAWYRDGDSDGYGTTRFTVMSCDQPTGYVAIDTDCNDSKAMIYPGATENCSNGVDDDCDGTADESDTTYYKDNDNDGYGDSATTTTGCAAPSGYVADNTDCNDADATVSPGLYEVCDGGSIDENCDGVTVSGSLYAGDLTFDSTNIADASSTLDGYCGVDGNLEVTGTTSINLGVFDGLYTVTGNFVISDNDNLSVTETFNHLTSVGGTLNFGSNDAITEIDGFTGLVEADYVQLTNMPALTSITGFTSLKRLINNGLLNITQNAALTDISTFNALETIAGRLIMNDNTALTNISGLTALTSISRDVEITGNTKLSSCVTTELTTRVTIGGTTTISGNLTDTDGDCVGDDDDDFPTDATRTTDTDGDGLDNTEDDDDDADGILDVSDNCATDANVDQADLDGDGTGDVCDTDADGDGSAATVDCNDADATLTEADDGDGDLVCDAIDCKPLDSTIYPGASELCDSIDNNCDGNIDENGATDGTVYYEDADGDHFGSTTSSITACTAPTSGYIAIPGDCDDTNNMIFPGATEMTDGKDNDCDGETDEMVSFGTVTATARDWSTGATFVSTSTGTSSSTSSSTRTFPGAGLATSGSIAGSLINQNKDSDGDGYTASNDCDDDNARVYPDSPYGEDGDGVDDDCNDADDEYEIDAVTGIWRGYKLDFEGDQAYEIESVGAGLWYGDESEPTGVTSSGDLVGVQLKLNARFDHSGENDVAYDWAMHYTGVLHDSSTLQVYRDKLYIICTDIGSTTSNPDTAPSNCKATESFGVRDKFGSDFYQGGDDYYYFVALDGFDVETYANNGTAEDPIGGEDLYVSAYIYNDTSKTNALDKDDGGASNGNDHYMGTDGKLTMYATMDYNGPTSNPKFIGYVYYTIIAMKKDVWSADWFTWSEGSVSGSTSTISMSGLTDLSAKKRAFAITYKLGTDGSEDGAFELDHVAAFVNLSSVSSETATVTISGGLTGYDGYTSAGDSRTINPDATSGYLIWCTDSRVCEAEQDSNSTNEGAASDGSGDNVDDAYERVMFND